MNTCTDHLAHESPPTDNFERQPVDPRTTHLCRELLHRLRSLEIALRDHNIPGEESRRRQDIVLRCFRDEGVDVDSETADLVIIAAPTLWPNRSPSDIEVSKFAEVLEKQLGFSRN